VRGRLITFEGGEGSGKSTQARRLAGSIDAVLTREPGGTAVGERLRAIALDRSLGHLDARAELLVMLAARAQHVAEVIRPALQAGRDVVCDRFDGSTLAYQGFGRGLPLEDVEVACALAADGLRPDLVVFLDTPNAVAAERRCGAADRIEDETAEFHARVQMGFRTLAAADPSHWAVIDGSGTIEAVGALVDRAIAEHLSPGASE
jgi:dTMP kinase